MRGASSVLPHSIAALERRGLSLSQALKALLLDPNQGHYDRGTAGRLLLLAHEPTPVPALLHLFFQQQHRDELYKTALTLEVLNDRRAVPALIHALLEDPNPHRRHAAARALGWIHPPNRATARALARCLSDPAQPQPAREEAAESLSYTGTPESVDALIAALSDPDPRIRFWAAFGLISSRGEARAVSALEAVLDDSAVPPGNWWSVGREALATLSALPIPRNPHHQRVAAEAQAILADPNAAPEDRRWAERYGPAA